MAQIFIICVNTYQPSHTDFQRTNKALASESMTGKTSLTGSTIQTRAAVAGVLLKRNIVILTLISMLMLIIEIMIIAIICNSNWTEWSTIQGVIGRVIVKLM